MHQQIRERLVNQLTQRMIVDLHNTLDNKYKDTAIRNYIESCYHTSNAASHQKHDKVSETDRALYYSPPKGAAHTDAHHRKYTNSIANKLIDLRPRLKSLLRTQLFCQTPSEIRAGLLSTNRKLKVTDMTRKVGSYLSQDIHAVGGRRSRSSRSRRKRGKRNLSRRQRY